MSIIQRGNNYYFSGAIEILSGSNASTPQAIDVSSWVPSGALSFRIQCPIFHALSDQYGNVDITLLCRLPGYQGTSGGGWNDAEDFAQFAGIYDSGMPANKLMGRQGATLEIPSIDNSRTFYWFPRGNTTINSAQAYLRLLSYRMPG